jgi:hypothetical protein
MIRIACMRFDRGEYEVIVSMQYEKGDRVYSDQIRFRVDGQYRSFPFIYDPAMLSLEERRATVPLLSDLSRRNYDELIEAIKEAPLGAVYALHGLLMTEAHAVYNTSAYEAVFNCELRLIDEVILPRDLYKELGK